MLFLIEPTILVSLISASQEIYCPLFCSSLYFMQNIPISKTLIIVTLLVWFKVSLIHSRLTNIRLARTLTLRVYPVLPVSNLPVLPYSFPWNSIFGSMKSDSSITIRSKPFWICDKDTKQIHVFTFYKYLYTIPVSLTNSDLCLRLIYHFYKFGFVLRILTLLLFVDVLKF